jgi:aminoglycoside 3-N-acetyltransferase I
VIGGLTAYILPSLYYPGSEAYLYDLAVAAPWKRQGIGTALLKALKEHGTPVDIKEIFVQADRPDQHAIDFYTPNGGIPGDVIHFSFAVDK